MKKMILLPTVGKSIEITEKRFLVELETDVNDTYKTEESQILKITYDDGFTIVLASYGYYEDALIALGEVTEEINKNLV